MKTLRLFLALLLATPLLTQPVFGYTGQDLHIKNRGQGNKVCLTPNDGGTLTDYVCANPTTHGVDIQGASDGGSASSGKVGELLGNSVANTTAAFGSNTWGDLTHIDLTPGDWMLVATSLTTGGSGVGSSCQMGMSTTSGNSAAGQNTGLNNINVAYGIGGTLVYQIHTASSPTYYLKWVCSYTSAPTVYYSFSARRMR